MKTIILSTFLLLSGLAFAQTAIPYYSGFDTPSEQAGWTRYKSWGHNYTWNITATNSPSEPNCAYFDMGLDTTVYDTLADYYISPSFDFSSGATLSFKYLSYYKGATAPHATWPGHLRVFILNNPVPSPYNNKMLLTLIDKVTPVVSGWRDTNDIIIPPTAGTSYIAFKYQCYFDREDYVLAFDNVYIGAAGSAGIKNQDKTIRAHVYPNPATDVLTVDIDQAAAENASLELVNLTGQTVLSLQQKLSAGNNSVSLNVNELAAGIYQLNIRTESGLSTQKVILQ